MELLKKMKQVSDNNKRSDGTYRRMDPPKYDVNDDQTEEPKQTDHFYGIADRGKKGL